MVNITVPIKQKDKFGFPRSEPQQTKQQDEKGLNEIQWLQKLADEGRLFEQSETITATEVFNEIIIPNGETFYLLEARGSINDTGTVTFHLIVNIGGKKTRIRSLRLTGNDSVDLTIKGFSLIGNGVDFIGMETTNATSQTGYIYGYTQQSRTLSSRGTTM